MSSPERLRLIGGTGSPYTQKMVALLRYRHIPYGITWADPTGVLDALGIEKPKPTFHPTFLFKDDNGKTEAKCDSTPIIRRLESMYSGRSVVPADPALAFLDYLIEDFGDEWCTKYMFHYRWYPSADAKNAGTLLPLTMDVSLPSEQHQVASRFFAERQIGRLYVVGSNDVTAPVIDEEKRLVGWISVRHGNPVGRTTLPAGGAPWGRGFRPLWPTHPASGVRPDPAGHRPRGLFEDSRLGRSHGGPQRPGARRRRLDDL